ncbi:hypothetical protein Q2T40_05660 [Winogradskyella maritima]|nr:hypothetical protein [Winogradskyella maritima]
MITLVEDAGKYILLDATETYSEVNILPQRALNWQGRLIKDDGTSGWIDLRPSEKSVETTSLNIKVNDDFTIEGKVRKV